MKIRLTFELNAETRRAIHARAHTNDKPASRHECEQEIRTIVDGVLIDHLVEYRGAIEEALTAELGAAPPFPVRPFDE